VQSSISWKLQQHQRGAAHVISSSIEMPAVFGNDVNFPFLHNIVLTGMVMMWAPLGQGGAGGEAQQVLAAANSPGVAAKRVTTMTT
jgi:hypothetical protein